MAIDNPAARLLNILEQGREIPPDMNCRKAWCQLLSVGIKDKAVLMGRLGKVMSLSTEILSRLNSIEGIKVERYIHWETPLDKAFLQNHLNGPWKAFKDHIDDHVINYLSMTSDLLSHKSPEPVLSRSSLDSILSNARDLIDEVKLSEIPIAIKEFMLKQLRKICLAVEEYEINGAESISSVVESAFGYGVLHGESVELAKTDGMTKKFWQNMANIALIVSISTGVQQLAAPIVNLLPEIDFNQELQHAKEEAATEEEGA
ncbi:MAG: hypothetical protein LAT61_09120 [Alcanivorax sp.]|nr:hypothetical protein [Alcanivorax sp.]